MGMLARGGAAVVNTGHYGVDPRYQLGALKYAFNFFAGELHNHQLQTFHLMSNNVQSYGALASFELNHGGHMSHPIEGNKVIGPMDGVMPDGRVIVKMDRNEMERVAEYFGNAAYLAKQGGFDMINVHAAHNWLLGQFLSPHINKREDEFGGTAENRARFPLMVLQAIRDRIGNDMLLSVRYSAAELVEGGATMDETEQVIRMMSKYADIVHCSAGKVDNLEASNFLFPSQFTKHGVNAYLAREVKKRVPEIKVEAIGAITDPAMADELIQNGSCDLVAMARSFIADNNWARKAKEGQAEDIRPCIRCLRCLNESVNLAGETACSVNPGRVLYQVLPSSEMAFKKKRVLVAGGGPAGMQAANELAKRGHEVILCEAGGQLGGRLHFADHVPFKHDLVLYRNYLIRQVEKAEHIEIRLNTPVTPQMVAKEKPDALILAMGAKDFLPPVPGIAQENVMHSSELFGREESLGGHIAIIGGGAVGCEAAIHLQMLGKKVELIEMADELMKADKEDYPDQRDFTLFYLKHRLDMESCTPLGIPENENVQVHLNAVCLEVVPEGVKIREQDGTVRTVKADHIIFATGLRPDKEMLQAFEGTARDVIYVGDSKKVGTIYHTSKTGLYAAMELS